MNINNHYLCYPFSFKIQKKITGSKQNIKTLKAAVSEI